MPAVAAFHFPISNITTKLSHPKLLLHNRTELAIYITKYMLQILVKYKLLDGKLYIFGLKHICSVLVYFI